MNDQIDKSIKHAEVLSNILGEAAFKYKAEQLQNLGGLAETAMIGAATIFIAKMIHLLSETEEERNGLAQWTHDMLGDAIKNLKKLEPLP